MNVNGLNTKEHSRFSAMQETIEKFFQQAHFNYKLEQSTFSKARHKSWGASELQSEPSIDDT